MSYILDALRRADAERERGAVPDLNAQPLALTIVDDEPPPRAGVPWVWLGAGALLALAGVAVWQFSGSAPPIVAQPAPAPMPMQMPVPAPAPAPAVVTPPSPPPVAAVAAPAPEPAASLPAVLPSAPTPARATAAKPAPPPKAAPAPEPPLPKYASLPEDLKSQIPALVVGGSVYSPRPASRMVILNGQVFHEGDTLAAGLTLEQIRPKAAVLSLRGQRFELPF